MVMPNAMGAAVAAYPGTFPNLAGLAGNEVFMRHCQTNLNRLANPLNFSRSL